MRGSLFYSIVIALVVAAPVPGRSADTSCVPKVTFQWLGPTTVKMWTDAAFVSEKAVSTPEERELIYATWYGPEREAETGLAAKAEAALKANAAEKAAAAKDAAARAVALKAAAAKKSDAAKAAAEKQADVQKLETAAAQAAQAAAKAGTTDAEEKKGAAEKAKADLKTATDAAAEAADAFEKADATANAAAAEAAGAKVAALKADAAVKASASANASAMAKSAKKKAASAETALVEAEADAKALAAGSTAPSQEAASQKTASKETASKQTASKETASKQTASKETASKETASKETASQKTASKDSKETASTGSVPPAENATEREDPTPAGDAAAAQPKAAPRKGPLPIVVAQTTAGLENRVWRVGAPILFENRTAYASKDTSDGYTFLLDAADARLLDTGGRIDVVLMNVKCPDNTSKTVHVVDAVVVEQHYVSVDVGASFSLDADGRLPASPEFALNSYSRWTGPIAGAVDLRITTLEKVAKDSTANQESFLASGGNTLDAAGRLFINFDPQNYGRLARQGTQPWLAMVGGLGARSVLSHTSHGPDARARFFGGLRFQVLGYNADRPAESFGNSRGYIEVGWAKNWFWREEKEQRLYTEAQFEIPNFGAKYVRFLARVTVDRPMELGNRGPSEVRLSVLSSINPALFGQILGFSPKASP